MCLAIPSEVLTIDGDQATVAVGEVKKTISLALVDGVQAGDYVLIHVGYALEKLDPVEAERTLEIFAEMGKPLAELVGDSAPQADINA